MSHCNPLKLLLASYESRFVPKYQRETSCLPAGKQAQSAAGIEALAALPR